MILSKEEKERRKQKRRQNKYNETHKVIDSITYKWCSYGEHWVIMDDDHFYKNKSNHIDGYHSWCKECSKEKAEKWQYDNYEHWKNLVVKRDSQPKRKQKKRQTAQRQRESGYQKEYRKENKDKIKQYTQFREMNKQHEIIQEEWSLCLDYFNNCCAYCGIHQNIAKEQQGNYLHKEHVDHGGANDLSNCVPSCKSCNSQKWKFALEDWYNENNIKFTEERLNKIHKWLNEDYKLYIKK